MEADGHFLDEGCGRWRGPCPYLAEMTWIYHTLPKLGWDVQTHTYTYVKIWKGLLLNINFQVRSEKAPKQVWKWPEKLELHGQSFWLGISHQCAQVEDKKGRRVVGFENCQQTSPMECSSSWADRLREGHRDAEWRGKHGTWWQMTLAVWK